MAVACRNRTLFRLGQKWVRSANQGLGTSPHYVQVSALFGGAERVAIQQPLHLSQISGKNWKKCASGRGIAAKCLFSHTSQKAQLKACKQPGPVSAIYKAHLVRVRTRQSPWQICSGCPPRRFCCRLYTSRVFKSCLVLPETWRRSLTKSLADKEGRMLMARFWRFHAFTLPCMGKPRNCLSYYLWRRVQTARTSCLPFNRLWRLSWLRNCCVFEEQSQKISQKVTRPSMSISWKHEYRTSCFQSHKKSQKSSQHATGGSGCVHFPE